MSSEAIAIRVQGLGKSYQIYDRPQDRLKQSLMPRLRGLIGKSTPNYYREFWALRDVTFEVRRGETVGIIGRNGSGKSTLLQIICGTLTPATGFVETGGRVAALLELGAGFNPEFTGRENVYLNGSLMGLSQEAIDKRFDAIAAFADIGEFIEQQVKTYSSGMYVRLAFAVIAHVDADILVIDEALAVGDVFFTRKCMRFLRAFMETGTVIFVSHDTAAVQNLCDRAVWLDRGCVRFIGSAKDAAALYLEAQYEGQSSSNDGPTSRVVSDRVDSLDIRDMRLDYINCTQFRNDIEIFQFDLGAASFGKGGGEITSVSLLSADRLPLSWVVGGENVVLEVRCKAVTNIYGPIVGFYLIDRLGQPLFGDNTYLTYHQAPLTLDAGRELAASFAFRMPVLPAGDYSVTVALAEGTQQDHIQHHWIHEALIIKSHATSVCQGLVGIPMQNVEIALTH
jgi:lipopolysaccharide transport system ATP-binding protein